MAFIYTPTKLNTSVKNDCSITYTFPSTSSLSSRVRTTMKSLPPPSSSSSLPSSSAQQQKYSRRSVLRMATLSLLLAPLDANAFSLNDLAVSGTVGTISLGREKAEGLKLIVLEWPKFSEDERLLVLRYIPIWLEPARVACSKLPDIVNSKKVDVDKLRTQANFMRGHLLELTQEADGFNTEGVIRELDEVIETADIIFDILKVAGIV